MLMTEAQILAWAEISPCHHVQTSCGARPLGTWGSFPRIKLTACNELSSTEVVCLSVHLDYMCSFAGWNRKYALTSPNREHGDNSPVGKRFICAHFGRSYLGLQMHSPGQQWRLKKFWMMPDGWFSIRELWVLFVYFWHCLMPGLYDVWYESQEKLILCAEKS